jgi:hypothetical protein
MDDFTKSKIWTTPQARLRFLRRNTLEILLIFHSFGVLTVQFFV